MARISNQRSSRDSTLERNSYKESDEILREMDSSARLDI